MVAPSTPPPGTCALNCAGHPHSRGVNRVCARNTLRQYGSSPLAWGQLIADPFRLVPHRVIPTRVGSTGADGVAQRGQGGHPHSRGVNTKYSSNAEKTIRVIPTRVGSTLIFFSEKALTCGSSPLAWGQQTGSFSFPEFFAGHPHSRGVNINGVKVFCKFFGSSPLAWGQLKKPTKSRTKRRVIPTRVGSTVQ